MRDINNYINIINLASLNYFRAPCEDIVIGTLQREYKWDSNNLKIYSAHLFEYVTAHMLMLKNILDCNSSI